MKKNVHIRPDGQNTTPVIYEILAGIGPEEEAILEFERGTYYFYRDGSKLFDIYSSGGKSTKNHVIFPVQDKKNLTIRGNGAEFVFCDRVQPFLFQNCRGLRLENFSVDYAFLRYAWGTVEQASEDGFGLSLDRERFDYFVDGSCLCFRAGADVISSAVRKFSSKVIGPGGGGIFFLYIGDTQAPAYAAAPNVLLDAEETATGVFLRYRTGQSPRVTFQPGDTVCIAYDNEREAQISWMEACGDVRIEDVTVYRGGGMGFVADLCEDIRIRRLRIGVKPGREEFYSTTADGIFLTNCSGVFELTDSRISDTYDDAMNIHGYYGFVDEVLSDNRVLVGYRHESHWGTVPFRVGDVLHVTEPEKYREIGTVTVERLEVGEERRRMEVTVTPDVVLAPGMLLENPDRMPKVLLENNTVKNCPHMRLSAGEMTVRNNRLELNDNDIYINDLIGFWGESGAVRNVLVCGNTFGMTAGGNILIRSFRPADSNRLHRGIRIENNRFAMEKTKALRISGVEEMKEENNIFGGGDND